MTGDAYSRDEINKRVMAIEEDEVLQKLIVAMLAAYPAYRRLKKFYKKEFSRDLHTRDFCFGATPIERREAFPFSRALSIFFGLSPDVSHPLFYELAGEAFSFEKEELYKVFKEAIVNVKLKK
jgi:hypothetical protein